MGGRGCQAQRRDWAGNTVWCQPLSHVEVAQPELRREQAARVLPASEATHMRPPSSFRAPVLTHRETGRCMWVTWQTPMHPSKPTWRPVRMPPPALTSIGDDLILFSGLALLSYLLVPREGESCPLGMAESITRDKAGFSAGKHSSSQPCQATCLTPTAQAGRRAAPPTANSSGGGQTRARPWRGGAHTPVACDLGRRVGQTWLEGNSQEGSGLAHGLLPPQG